MSRPAHLPPRCPSQSRLTSPRVTDSSSQSPFRDDESQHSKHRRSPSQGSTFDDLLTNLEATPRGLFLRRASSDPTSIMEVLDNPILSISVPQPSVNQSEDAKTGCGFEADYVYGPNSPRQKGKLTQSESSMVSALLETVPQNPLQYLAVDVTGGLRTDESDIISEDHSVGGDFDSEKARRRYIIVFPYAIEFMFFPFSCSCAVGVFIKCAIRICILPSFLLMLRILRETGCTWY